MYAASAAFHDAIRQNAPQRALLLFNDAFFTNEDINVENGIEFIDVFNSEQDLSIGQALSNEIRFTLYNDGGFLNDYEFGEFTALIGAKVSESMYKQRAYVTAVSGGNTYLGQLQHPYLTRNGTSMSVMFPVHGIFIVDDTVHVFGTKGYYAAFSDSTGQPKTISTNAFMMNKVSRLEAVGMTYKSASKTMTEYLGGFLSTYEFVPLGVFTAVRPNVGTVIEIDFSCNDRMQLFDKDMPEDLEITYPITLKGLLDALCAYVNVTNGASTFVNSTAEIKEEPENFKKSTMRKVIGWIAEAACANARFDRDGVLQLDWITSTSQSFSEGQYVEFNPYWYTVPKVTKVYNRDTANTFEAVQGDGTSGYLIQDNPFIGLVETEFKVTSSPQDAEVDAGDTVTMSALGTGGDISYQWQRKANFNSDWADIDGATSTSYSFTATDNDDMSRYRCKMKLFDKTLYSEGAGVFINYQPDSGGDA